MRIRAMVITACVTAVAAATVATVGLSGTAGAVDDGRAAPAGDFPFSVKFTMTDVPRPDGSHQNSACSGALIGRQWVITAGHCFHDVNYVRVGGRPRYKTTATLGTVDLTGPGNRTLAVVDVRQSAVNDIALAKLAEPVKDIEPVKLDSAKPTIGEKLVLAGWGATSSTNPVPSTHLNLGTVAVGSISPATLDVHGVAPRPDTSACLYDSGAPYFKPIGNRAGRVVSIESHGPDCPNSGPETTSRVDVVASWIAEQIGN